MDKKRIFSIRKLKTGVVSVAIGTVFLTSNFVQVNAIADNSTNETAMEDVLPDKLEDTTVKTNEENLEQSPDSHEIQLVDSEEVSKEEVTDNKPYLLDKEKAVQEVTLESNDSTALNPEEIIVDAIINSPDIKQESDVTELDTKILNSTSLLPEEELYDNTTISPYRSVSIFHGVFLQYLDSYEGNETIDESIRKAMNFFNEKVPNAYKFESVNVEYEEIIWNLSTGYYGPGHDISIAVKALYDSSDWIKETITIPYETRYVENSEELLGTKKIIQVGVNGQKIVNTEYYYLDGIIISQESLEVFDKVVSESMDQIISVGTREILYEEEVRALPFEVSYIDNEDLLVGEENIIKQGVNGESRVTVEVNYVKGVEVSRVEAANTIITNPVTQIVERGTKVISIEKDNTVTILDAFLNNNNFIPGEKVQLTVNFSGETKLDYMDVNYLSDMGVELYNSTYVIETLDNGIYRAVLDFIMPEIESQKYTLNFLRYGWPIEENLYTVNEENLPFNLNFTLANPDYIESKKPEILELYLEENTILDTEAANLIIISDYGEAIDYVDVIIFDSVTGLKRQFSTRLNEGKHEILDNGNIKTVLNLGFPHLPSGIYQVEFVRFIDVFNQYNIDHEIVREIQLSVYKSLEEKLETVLPFETIYVDNPTITINTEVVLQEGVNGLQTITEKVSSIRGLEIQREVISNLIQAPINKIIQVGTKAAVIEDIATTTKSETRTEVVSFEIEYVNNPNLLAGIEEVSQAGVNGERTIVEEVTTVGNEETGRVLISSEVTTPPVTKVIQVGTKATVIEDIATTTKNETKTEVISFETEYVNNPNLLLGVEEVSQIGVDGVRTIVEKVTKVGHEEPTRELISNEITTAPVTKVIQVGTKAAVIEDIATTTKNETRTEVIPFETEYVNNSDLLVGTEQVSQIGVEGERTIVEKVTTVGSEEAGRKLISSEVTTAPVTEIIQVGTKAAVIEDIATITKNETKTEVVRFETKYVNNPDLPTGTEEVSQAGVDGERTIVEEVSYINGEEISREIISDTITTKPVTKIIERGTQVTEVKTELRKEVLAYEVKYVENVNLEIGLENILTEGINGVITIKEEVTYVNGKVTNRKFISEDVTALALDQVVEIGTKDTQVKSETRTETVEFIIEYVDNPDLNLGVEKILTEGSDGTREVTEDVTYVNGIETNRIETASKISLAPINQIIERGTQVTEVKTETRTENIPFEIEYQEGSELNIGEEIILTAGVNGSVTITEEVTYVNGVAVKRIILSEEVMAEPTTQLVLKGTKVVEPEEGIIIPTVPIDESTSNEDSSGPDVSESYLEVRASTVATLPETGEKENFTLFSAASLAILAGLGLIATGKKREEE